MRHLNPRAGAHLLTMLLALVLAATMTSGTASASVTTPTEDDPLGDVVGDDPTKEPRQRQARRTRPAYKMASLNLHNTMGREGIRHDVRQIIRDGASVIGMQERRGTKPAVKAALPKHWRLAMPTRKDGADDNPIAWNTRVWKVKNTWPALLTKRTWYRDGYGKTAVDQYAVVAVLRHRASGHVVRAASLHMPNQIQTQRGGPRYSERDRVEAFWRMSRSVRRLAGGTPGRHQFAVMCDCNVSYTRDRGDKLLKGKVSRPLKMASNYSAGGTKSGWQIDYVLAERGERYRIKSWRVHHDLRTDHPGVVTRFVHR
jgi:hypothetical protein